MESSQDSYVNLVDQLSFTNQDCQSNIFATINVNKQEEVNKEDFTSDIEENLSQVILETEEREDTSIINPLEQLTSDNGYIEDIDNSDKPSCKSKRLEICSNITPTAKGKNIREEKENIEGYFKASLSEAKQKKKSKNDI